MRSPPSIAALCLCLALGALGSSRASGQFIQGTDDDALVPDPDTWTAVPLDLEALNNTVAFMLNPCEYVLYRTTAGQPKTCMPQASAALCDKLDDMKAKLEDALDFWRNLSSEGLNLPEVLILEGLGGGCPTQAADCPLGVNGGWVDDGQSVVTRTYSVSTLDPVQCPSPASLAQSAGLAMRLYTDPPDPDHTTRYVRETDILYHTRSWDVTEDHDCLEAGRNPIDCVKATTMGLVHEVGHAFGFGHQYLTRRTLEPVKTKYNVLDQGGLMSMMSYDHPGSIDLFDTGLNIIDQAAYLYNYAPGDADPNDTHFRAYGTVVYDQDDNNCGNGVGTGVPVFGAAVVALLEGSPRIPVHLGLTGLDPLDPGAFELEHLPRGGGSNYYRFLVLDARNENQLYANGWNYDESASGVPQLSVIRTDLWSVENSGDDYRFEASAFFDTGFEDAVKPLLAQSALQAPAQGFDLGPLPLCVEF